MQWLTPPMARSSLLPHVRRNGCGVLRAGCRLPCTSERVVRLVVAVAQGEALDVGHIAAEGHAQHGGGVDEVDDPGIGRQLVRRRGPSSRACGISRRARKMPPGPMVSELHMRMPCLAAIRGVDAAEVGVAIGEGQDDEVGIVHAPCGGRWSRRRLTPHFVCSKTRSRQLHHGDKHFGSVSTRASVPPGHDWAGGHLVDDGLAEEVASRSDDGDLRSTHLRFLLLADPHCDTLTAISPLRQCTSTQLRRVQHGS